MSVNVISDFQKRYLEVLRQNSYIKEVARRDRKVIGADFFSYNINISAVASGAVSSGRVTIQADSDFVLAYMAGSQVVSNAVVASPVSTIQITDTGTGRTFFNTELPFGSVFGSGGFPFLLPAPRVFAPNTTILAEITNINSAAAADYYMNFLGTRIYYA